MSGNNLGGLSSGNRTINGFTDTGSSASLTVGDELKLKTTSKIYIGQNQGTEGQVITRAGDGIVWQAQADTKGVSITNRDTSHDISVLHPTFIGDYTGSSLSSHVDVFSAKNTLILDPSNAIFDISNVALRIPRGASAGRPKNLTAEDVGYIRYNTQLNQFEGFGAGAAWGSLGGVKDIDGDTYITAESTPDSDKLQFYTADAERMVIDPTGKVGIGTTDPKENLEISGDTARLRIYDGTSSKNPGIEFVRGSTTFGGDESSDWRIHNDGGKLKFYTDGTDNNAITGNIMSLDYTGNVGIGTTSPSTTLQITKAQADGKSSGTYAHLYLNNSSTTSTTGRTSIFLHTSYTTNSTYGISLSADRAGTDGTPTFAIRTHKASEAGSTALTVKNSGNVGIGTTTPAAKFQVDGSANITDNLMVSGTIRTGGNVGIGNSPSGSYKLKVYGTTNLDGDVTVADNLTVSKNINIADGQILNFGSSTANQHIRIYGGNNSAYGIGVQSSTLYFRTHADFCFFEDGSHVGGTRSDPGTNGTVNMIIKQGGNVGIGTTDPSGKLHVYNGNILLENSGSDALDNKIIFREAGYDDRFFIATDLAHGPSNQQSLRFGFTNGGDAGITNDNVLVNIRGDGNVGIGTTDPETYKLKVDGSANITGNLTAGRAAIGNSHHTDYSAFGHKDTFSDQYNYALRQDDAGTTLLNCALAKTLYIRQGNSSAHEIKLNANGGTMDIKRNVDITGVLTVAGTYNVIHDPNSQGPRTHWADFMTIGAYSSKNNIDNKNRIFRIRGGTAGTTDYLTIATGGDVEIANNLTVGGTITGNGSGLTNITKAMVGLGNVANVALGNVTNESKATMFASPTFTGRPIIKTTNNTSAGLWILEKNASNNNEGFFIGRTNVGTEDDFGIYGKGADDGTAAAWRLKLDKNGRMLLGDDLDDTSIDTNYQLQVNGTANITGDLTVGGTITGNGSGLTNITKAMVGLGNVTNESKATMFTNPTFTGDLTVSAALGIGTAAPNSKFLIDLQRSGENNYIRIQGADTSSDDKYSGILFSEHNNEYGWYIRNSGNDYLYFSKSNGDGTNINNKITINTHGDVTIAEDLTVSGTITGNGSGLTNITKAMVGLGNVTNESKATMFTNPSFTGDLTVSKNINIAGGQVLNLGSSTANQHIRIYGGNNSAYGIGVQSSTLYFRTHADFCFFEDGSHVGGTRSDPGTNGTVNMIIQEGGKVGIGTSDPGDYKLKVNGTANITGALTVGGDFIHIDGKEAIDGNDSWLRLNQNGDFTSGTHIPGKFYVAGNLQVGGQYQNGKAHIHGSVWKNYSSVRYFAKGSGVQGSYGSNTRNTSLYCSNDVVCMELQVFSDRRIKENIEDYDDALALDQVRKIPCRYFNFKDTISTYDHKILGFIAQEVNELLPSAVSIVSDFIPNIFKNIYNITWEEIKTDSGSIQFKMSSPELTNLTGSKYRFYVSDNDDNSDETEIMIEDVSNDCFIFEKKWNHIFCYGKEVDDFHALDQQKIFALHHPAIQELDRQQQADKTRIAALENENSQLKTRVSTLESQLTSVLARLSALDGQ